MNQHQPPNDDVAALLDADRELSPEEQGMLCQLGEATWRALTTILLGRVRKTYAPTAPDLFAVCVSTHMSALDCRQMAGADLYWCPECGNILKDRGSVVANGLMEAEESTAGRADDALACLRRALGL